MVSDELFAERLLQVIDEGRRTATYKLALLTALIDACAAEADEHGAAPAELHTRTVARHVVRLYLPQVRLYLAGDGDPMQLRQIAANGSPVFGALLRLHMLAEQHGVRGPAAIARSLHDEHERCLDEVERTFARYPLRLLQVVGREPRPFLYDVDWSESVTLAALHAKGGGVIRFRPGAGDHLLRLAPLIRPLIETHWTRMVARLNRIDLEGERLHDHLFGTSRINFPPKLRAGLLDLQDGACFYCDRPLKRSEIDHFVPWSRWPNDALENLVLADSCNSHKRDYLPAQQHVERWADRLSRQADDLALIATSCRWESDRARSVALARSCYRHLPPGTPLWLRADTFTDDPPGRISARLSSL